MSRRETIVRTTATPAPAKRSHKATSRLRPTPHSRRPSATWMAKTQPAVGEPNSHARTSPTTKPITAPADSATRKLRSLAAAPSNNACQYSALTSPVLALSIVLIAAKSAPIASRTEISLISSCIPTL